MTPSLGSRVRTRLSLATLSLTLLAFSSLFKLGAVIWLKRHPSFDLDREYSYIGNDYPETWEIERLPVLMASDNSNHFHLNTSDGIAEWSSIVPGNGLIYLGASMQPYSLSMLHQLQCLDIIREYIVRDHTHGMEGDDSLGRHCLNYLQQMVLCRADVQLESFHYASNRDPIDLNGVYECKDWGAVYDEVRKNQLAHDDWVASQTQNVAS